MNSIALSQALLPLKIGIVATFHLRQAEAEGIVLRRSETERDKKTDEVSTDDLSKLEVLSIDEFCRWARISRASVYRCIKDGTLTSAKLRNRTIIRREDALRFIAGLPSG